MAVFLRRVANGLQAVWRSFRRDEQVTLGLCALFLVFCAGVKHSQRRSAQALPPLLEEPTESPAKMSITAKVSKSTRRIMVHVSGAVRHPGVRQLPEGARLRDAVHAAGGVTPRGDVNAVNLAARLQNGQQVVLPTRGDVPPISSTLNPVSQRKDQRSAVIETAPSVLTGKINLNMATSTQLEALPGIGPAIAVRIVQYRQQRGRFRSLQDLDQVKGLGPKKLDAIRDHVTF